MRKALIQQTATLIRKSEDFDMEKLPTCIIGHYIRVRFSKKVFNSIAQEYRLISDEAWVKIRPQIAKDFGLTEFELKEHPLFQLETPLDEIVPMSRTKAANALVRTFL